MTKHPPKKKPYKIEFENEAYKIRKIPKNWAIDIKVKSKTKKDKNGNPTLLLPETFYLPTYCTLDYVKEAAEYWIKKYS